MTYLALAPHVSLRALEDLFLYDRARDELFELNEEAWEFLEGLDGTAPVSGEDADPEFVGYLRSEELVVASPDPRPARIRRGAQPPPSLRYLELYLTERCNLRCLHCFRGAPSSRDLPLSTVGEALNEFDRLGGLRLLVTGGEALLHPDFWAIQDMLRNRGFRAVLLSNGTLLEEAAPHLDVDEVQVSLDGMEEGHDRIRGRGSFRRAVAGLEAAAAHGIEVSVATMVHAENLGDFDALGRLVRGLGVRSWQVDAPTVAGELAAHPELISDPREAGWRMRFGFGGAYHGGTEGHVCGYHLMTVFPDGSAAKCGFYPDDPVGHVGEGLKTIFDRIPRPPVSNLECAEIECPVLLECRGGCRFRAAAYNGKKAPDQVQCHRFRVAVRSINEGGCS